MPGPPVYACPVDVPVSVVGGKWKLVILFYLLQQPRRTGELRRLIPAISQKMLTQQLRELAADGLVTRTVYDQVPPKVVYDVEPAERARLGDLLRALCDWGLYWSARTDARILALEHGGASSPAADAAAIAATAGDGAGAARGGGSPGAVTRGTGIG